MVSVHVVLGVSLLQCSRSVLDECISMFVFAGFVFLHTSLFVLDAPSRGRIHMEWFAGGCSIRTTAFVRFVACSRLFACLLHGVSSHIFFLIFFLWIRFSAFARQAAMASLHFKVKEFDFAEKLWRPICIRWTGEAPVAIASCSQQQEQQQQQQTEGAAVASCQEIELPIGTPTNTMRKITFIRSCPLELHATYKDLEGKTRAADLGNAFFISRIHMFAYICISMRIYLSVYNYISLCLHA